MTGALSGDDGPSAGRASSASLSRPLDAHFALHRREHTKEVHGDEQ